jgi:hypothetical protein
MSKSRFARYQPPRPDEPVLQTRPEVLTRPLRTLDDWHWRYPFTDRGQIEKELRTDPRY